MGKIIKDLWEGYGFQVEQPTYEVLLSYPKTNATNRVYIFNQTGQSIFEVSYIVETRLLSPSSIYMSYVMLIFTVIIVSSAGSVT